VRRRSGRRCRASNALSVKAAVKARSDMRGKPKRRPEEVGAASAGVVTTEEGVVVTWCIRNVAGGAPVGPGPPASELPPQAARGRRSGAADPSTAAPPAVAVPQPVSWASSPCGRPIQTRPRRASRPPERTPSFVAKARPENAAFVPDRPWITIQPSDSVRSERPSGSAPEHPEFSTRPPLRSRTRRSHGPRYFRRTLASGRRAPVRRWEWHRPRTGGPMGDA
jgi:hypothetical protein